MEDLELLADYRQRMIHDTRFVKLAGIPLPRDLSGRPIHIQVPLDRVYIRIQAVLEETSRAQREAERIRVEEEARDESLLACDLNDDTEAVRALGEYRYRQDQKQKEAERPKPVDTLDALSEHKRIAILGAPGAGKSTMLRYLARKAAEDVNAPIPILVSLRDYATYCGIGGTESLYDFALDEVAKLYNFDKTNLLRAIGKANRILWLVDGLDEARGWREKVVGQIGQLPGDLVITSRPVGYQKAGLESLPHFEILPLETEDVDKFLKDWFGVLADQGGLGPEWVSERVSWLKDQLRDRPRIGALTNNPLLLTFLVILGGEDPLQDLPTSRGELYQSYVEKLLNSWEVNRRPRCGAEGTPELSLGTLTGNRARGAALDGFYFIGWRLHFVYYGGKGEEQPTYEFLVNSLEEKLKEKWNLAHGDAKITAEDIVEFWNEAGVLDVWRLGKREYLAFRHLTFEEYSAAKGLAEAWKRDPKVAWKFLLPRLHHYAWREPILLLAGMMDQYDANELLRNLLGLNHRIYRVPRIRRLLRPTCLPHGPSKFESFLHRDLFLAGVLLVQRPQIDQNIKDEIIYGLSWLIHPHENLRFVTFLATYLMGLAITGLILYYFLLPNIFFGITLLWTAAWVGAFVFGIFPRIQSILGVFQSIWSYFPDERILIRLIGQIGDIKVVSDLILALKDSDRSVRSAAAEALGHIGSPAVPDLILALKDGDRSVRSAAAKALGHIGSPAVPDLILALKDGDQSLRADAAKALGHIGSPAVPDLILALKDGDQRVRWAATTALGQAGDVRAVPDLILALKDGDRSLRADAAFALYQIGDIQAVPDLILALKDGDQSVRWAATTALGQAGDVRAVPDLILALKDENESLRSKAAEALGQIGDVKAVFYLILALKDGDWGVRSDVAKALGQIGDVQAVPDLILALKDGDWGVRSAVAKALGQIGSPAVPDLILALKDGDRSLRSAAARSLGQIGDVQAVPYLILALKDGDCGVRFHSNPVLGGRSQLIRALNEGASVRQVAVKALGQIGDVQAVPDLIQALKDEKEFLRRNAAEALGQIGDVRAVPDLIRALKDGDGDVRMAAAEALGRLAGKLKKLDDARSVSRALRWRLTDQIFDVPRSETAFHVLNQAASSLAVLEVEALPAEDPLSRSESTGRSNLHKCAKPFLKAIVFGILTLVLQIIYATISGQEGNVFTKSNLLLIVAAIVLSALIFILQEHKSKEPE